MNVSPRLDSLSAMVEDFANAPFRLFFLTACLPAVFGALCWALSYLDDWLFVTQPIDLQYFFFLQSFAGAAFAGFFFTAFPRWLGDATPLGNHIKLFWLITFFATLLAPLSLSVALSMMVLFWGYALALLVWLAWKNHDGRYISLLLMLAVIDLLTLRLAIKAGQTPVLTAHDWQQQLHIVVLGAVLISFYFGKALGNQALKDSNRLDSQFIPNPYVNNLSIWLFYLLLINNLAIRNSVMEGWLSLAIAGVLLGRLRDWHFAVLLKKYYVRWLYATLLIIAVGYAWRGLALIECSASPWLNPMIPLHIITVSGFLLMMYQLFTIVGLRHSNRDLVYPWTNRLGLFALLLAGITRTTGSVFALQYYPYVKIYLPNGLVILAFSLYFIVFYRLFIRYAATVPKEGD